FQQLDAIRAASREGVSGKGVGAGNVAGGAVHEARQGEHGTSASYRSDTAADGGGCVHIAAVVKVLESGGDSAAVVSQPATGVKRGSGGNILSRHGKHKLSGLNGSSLGVYITRSKQQPVGFDQFQMRIV